jgi:hypothetical protein
MFFPPKQQKTAPVSSSQELSKLYTISCEKHNTTPIPSIINHLETINLDSPTSVRAEILNLRNETLTHESCEALEELFKRVKYRSIDLTSCSLDDVSSTAIFDMIEYYEACNELNISENPNIKNRGWQSCKCKQLTGTMTALSVARLEITTNFNRFFYFFLFFSPGINMIKRSRELHSLFTRGTLLSDANGNC